jgi:hypothetical protein
MGKCFSAMVRLCHASASHARERTPVRSRPAPWLISLEISRFARFASFGAHLRIRHVVCLPGGPDGAVFGNVSHLGLRRC